MNEHDNWWDDWWFELQRACEPDAALLAAEDDALAGIADPAPLTRQQIDACVAAAGQRALPPRAKARWRLRMPLLAAAILLVALPATAWFAHQHWPERKHSPLYMSFGEAIALCNDHASVDSTRVSALSVLLNHGAFGLDALLALRDDPVPAVRDRIEMILQQSRSRAARNEHSRASGAGLPRAQPPAGDYLAALAIARDPVAEPDARLVSLDILGAHIDAALLAFATTRITSQPYLSRRDEFAAALARRLQSEQSTITR